MTDQGSTLMKGFDAMWYYSMKSVFMKKFSIALAMNKKAMCIYAPSKFVKTFILLSKMKLLVPFATMGAIVAAPAIMVVGAAMNIKILTMNAIDHSRRELCL